MKKACRAQYDSEIFESESAINKPIQRIKKRNPKYYDEISDEECSTKKKTKSTPLPPEFGNIYIPNIPIIKMLGSYYFSICILDDLINSNNSFSIDDSMMLSVLMKVNFY